jgi:hypothetical protein
MDRDYFRARARRRASRELKRREKDWRGRAYEELELEAYRLIETFVTMHLL